jgi:hypothetical protein
MPLYNYLSAEEFYTRSGIDSCDVSDVLVRELVDVTNSLLTQNLSELFSITPVTGYKYYMQNSPRLVSIGVWQSANLNIKKGNDRSSSLVALQPGNDYRLFYANNSHQSPSYQFPAIAVRLQGIGLSTNDYLQIDGNYGYSADVPTELLLKQKLYSLIQSAVYGNQIQVESGGYDSMTSAGIDKVRIEFGDNSKLLSVDQAMDSVTNIIMNIQSKYDFSDMIPSVIG